MPEPGSNLDSVIQRILALLFDASRNQRAKLSLFVGAGVSREYGIPTTLGFAKLFFEDALSGLSDETRASIHLSSDEDQIRQFVKMFKEQLDSDLAYAFFKRIERESLTHTQIDEIITYDRIIDLWRNGYVKVVVTTNFDSLIEHKIAAQQQGGAQPTFELAVLDYHDLSHADRPGVIDAAILVKIAGQIERSNMLWTEDDFSQQLTERVLRWLAVRIADTPLVLLGYTASEPPLAELLAQHPMYAASVVPRPLSEIGTLAVLHSRRVHLHDHVMTTASAFVAALYESLYEHTKDPNLALSYRSLQERIERLNAERVLTSLTSRHIPRTDTLTLLLEFAQSGDRAHRCLVLLGESGYGKSVLVRSLAEEAKEELVIYIPGNELNSTLDEWLSRLDNIDVSYICRLTRLLSKNLILVIDGLNECLDTIRAKSILQDLVRVLDVYNGGHVRAIVTVRTDYWTRLRFDFHRVYVRPPIELGAFNDTELALALDDVRGEASLRLPRWKYLHDLLRVPQLYGFFAQLGGNVYAAGPETSLYRALLEKREAVVPDANRTLIWLCIAIRRLCRLSVPLLDLGVDADLRAGLSDLTSAGMLRVNRFDMIRFAEDRMAEFIFGELYLYQYCWRTHDTTSTNGVEGVFRDLVGEYSQLGREALEYKLHFFNSLIFFAARCTDDEIVLLHGVGSTFERTIIRAAVVLRRQIEPRPELLDDPVMMAVAALDKTHYDKLLQLVLTGDEAFFSAIPFNYGAKLFPEQFLDFIEFLLDHIADQDISIEMDRRYSTLLIDSVLIYVLRNGPQQLFVRPRFREKCQRLRDRTSAAFLGARTCEALEQNSRYLFYYHPTDKVADIFQLEWYWRERLIRALQGSVFDVPTSEILALLRLNSVVRLLMRFVFFRDLHDPRLVWFVDEVFRTDSIVAQDFCLSILGWAGKLDAAFIELSESCVIRMHTLARQNFYSQAIDEFDGIDSQYDPLVPHVTTLMLRGLPVDLAHLAPGFDQNAAYRVGRLAQKTMLDFPEETLAMIYKFLEDGENHREIHIALRVAARFSPVSFWKVARQRHPEDLFEVDSDEIAEITRVLAQVRDFDWFHTMAWATASPARKTALTEALLALLGAKSLDTFLRSVIETITPPWSADDGPS